jgi:hypothetical protein
LCPDQNATRLLVCAGITDFVRVPNGNSQHSGPLGQLSKKAGSLTGLRPSQIPPAEPEVSDYQRVRKPEFMSVDESVLSVAQIEMLGRYRDRERELDNFIDHAVSNAQECDRAPAHAVGSYKHRLEKLADALDRLIIDLN